jgi:DNA-directed RNA polymerase specialized sigma subunit
MEREDLYTLRKAMKNIDQLKEQIAALELRRISPRSAAYGSGRVQSSTKGDIQAEQIAKIDELLETYRFELNQILDLQAEFEKVILPLDPFDKKIMRYYYIKGLIWEEVWQLTGMSTKQLCRRRDKILDTLFPFGEKNQKNVR